MTKPNEGTLSVDPDEALDRLRGDEERRALPELADAEVQVETRGNKVRFTGYAAIFDMPYRIPNGPLGPFDETVERGAFDHTLSRNPVVRLKVDHQGWPLAKTPNSLRLGTDSRGLISEADLNPRDPDVQRVLTKMEDGLIDKMSFAFRAVQQKWNDDYSKRRLIEVNLDRGDVSIVDQPANDATTARIQRSLSAVMEVLREMDPEEMVTEARSLGAAAGLTVIEARDLFARLAREVTPQERRTLSVDEALNLINP